MLAAVIRKRESGPCTSRARGIGKGDSTGTALRYFLI